MVKNDEFNLLQVKKLLFRPLKKIVISNVLASSSS